MTESLLRDSIDMLLQEAYDGPADPKATWFITTEPDCSVLGTIRHLTASQAWRRPDGLSHSVAEHVAHILFSLNHASKCAAADRELEADWDASWEVGAPDAAHWLSLQRQLREAHLRLRMWVHADETFASRENVSRLVATIAHTAYHLGAIRQVAALAIRSTPAQDPTADYARPL